MTNTSPRIGFLTPYFEQTRGNATTAKRIVHHLREQGFSVEVFAYEEQQWTDTMRKRLKACSFFHILHFFRYVKWLDGAENVPNRPYIVTSGGTDINRNLLNNEDKLRMKHLIEQAEAVTVFTEDGRQKVSNNFPGVTNRLHVIPQAVWFPKDRCETKHRSGEEAYPKILLPAGLRQVKDVLFLLRELIVLQKHFSNIKFTIAGAVLDETVHAKVLQAKKHFDWLDFVQDVPFEEMQHLYKWSDIVLNTSISEGQSSALLEAMFFGKLMMARRNPGNESVISDGENGFLYEDGAEFLEKLKLWLEKPSLRKEIAEKAMAYVREHHSPEKEVQHYIDLYQ